MFPSYSLHLRKPWLIFWFVFTRQVVLGICLTAISMEIYNYLSLDFSIKCEKFPLLIYSDVTITSHTILNLTLHISPNSSVLSSCAKCSIWSSYDINTLVLLSFIALIFLTQLIWISSQHCMLPLNFLIRCHFFFWGNTGTAADVCSCNGKPPTLWSWINMFLQI